MKELINYAERFKDKATAIHNGKYTYDNFVYIGALKKSFITCLEHGDFEQRPDNHLSGRGCPDCAETGYNPAKKGCLYLWEFYDGYEVVTIKIGITNISPEVRLNAYGVPEYLTTPKTATRELWFEDGNIPAKIESKIKTHFKSKLLNNKLFTTSGNTELFQPDTLAEMIILIDKLAKKYSK